MSSMPYLKGDAPSQLDVYVPKITRAYITSRLESGGWQPLLFSVASLWNFDCARSFRISSPAGWSRVRAGRLLAVSRAQLEVRARRWLPGSVTAARSPCPAAAVQAVVLQGASEDPLDNDEQLQASQSALPRLARQCFPATPLAASACARSPVPHLDRTNWARCPTCASTSTPSHSTQLSPPLWFFCAPDLQDQMDSLPYLCRFQYAETAEYLTSLTDPLIAAFQGFGGSAAGQVRRGCCQVLCQTAHGGLPKLVPAAR